MAEFYEDLKYRLDDFGFAEHIKEFIEYELGNSTAQRPLILQFVIGAVIDNEPLLQNPLLINDILKEVHTLLLQQNRHIAL